MITGQMKYVIWDVANKEIIHECESSVGYTEALEYLKEHMREGEAVIYLVQEMQLPRNFWQAVADAGKE